MLAGVSRRHPLTEKETANVSLEVLCRLTDALDMDEVHVGSVRLRATPPNVAVLVRAGDVVGRAKRAALALAAVVQDFDQAQTESTH